VTLRPIASSGYAASDLCRGRFFPLLGDPTDESACRINGIGGRRELGI
jgi:hypothetical protein